MDTALLAVMGGVISVAFSAGGVVIGMKIQSDQNTQNHKDMKKNIDHLDEVKQSKVVCMERHGTVETALLAINANINQINENVKWLRDRNGGGSK